MSCSIDQYRARIGLFTYNHTNKHFKNNNNVTPPLLKNTNRLKTILFLLILVATITNTNYSTNKQLNKQQHITNGNSFLSLVHWNKGRSLFYNKINDIDNILTLHRPHIFSICEANADKLTNNTLFNRYKDYTVEHTKMANTTNRS